MVNNAGYGFAGTIEETSTIEAKEIFDVNFFGSLQVTQAFLPMLRHQKSGHIIQISLMAALKHLQVLEFTMPVNLH